MTRLSQMKFSRKIFLAIFGTTCAAALIICLVVYGALSNYRSSDFESDYIDHMNLLAKTLGRIEESHAHIAMNAALNVKTLDSSRKGRFSSEELKDLSQQMGVTAINVYSMDGKALSSISGNPLDVTLPGLKLTPNLSYKTPLTRGIDANVELHTIISSQDNKRFIEVVLSFDAVTHLLREMIEHDEDNLSVALVGANNERLGLIERPGYSDTNDLNKFIDNKDGAYWLGEHMIVVTTLKHGSEKAYRLITTISTRFLHTVLHKIRITLIAVAVLLILFSIWVSKALTKILLSKVEKIRKLLANITQNQDYSERVETDPASKDELDELGGNLNHMLETLQSHQRQLLDAERDKARTQIAAQVAHDIRSPLMSMNMALSQLESPQVEVLAILKSAVARIAGIAKKLSSASAKPEETSSVETPKLTLVEPLIASVVNEHRVRKQDHQTLNFTGIGSLPNIWSVVQVSEIQSAISNIINNAFEAGATTVNLNLSTEGKKWSLAIQDNGAGIPDSILEKIFERSFTHGKKTGTGLGLFQAKSAVEWSGGELQVKTKPGAGTTFTLVMPKEKTPTWLPAQIEVEQDQTLCFVDDDNNVLNNWKEKAQRLGLSQAHFFASIAELEAWSPLRSFPQNGVLIIDQNLRDTKKGLDVIAELAISKRAYLCTSEFDEKWVQDQVKKFNANLIPKPWISQFELKVRSS